MSSATPTPPTTICYKEKYELDGKNYTTAEFLKIMKKHNAKQCARSIKDKKETEGKCASCIKLNKELSSHIKKLKKDSLKNNTVPSNIFKNPQPSLGNLMGECEKCTRMREKNIATIPCSLDDYIKFSRSTPGKCPPYESETLDSLLLSELKPLLGGRTPRKYKSHSGISHKKNKKPKTKTYTKTRNRKHTQKHTQKHTYF